MDGRKEDDLVADALVLSQSASEKELQAAAGVLVISLALQMLLLRVIAHSAAIGHDHESPQHAATKPLLISLFFFQPSAILFKCNLVVCFFFYLSSTDWRSFFEFVFPLIQRDLFEICIDEH
ncbi:hypothetical protein DMENIID0001_118880 [Sergentomyia squamirostris]